MHIQIFHAIHSEIYMLIKYPQTRTHVGGLLCCAIDIIISVYQFQLLGRFNVAK